MTAPPIADDAILTESLLCLVAHLHPEWGDRHPFDVFNRLIAKNSKPAAWTTNTHLLLTAAQVASRREQWTAEALGRLVRGHKGTGGDDFDCPIILVEYRGAVLVLDGNHRINRWVAAGDTRQHRVNIHAVTAEAEYVELSGRDFPA